MGIFNKILRKINKKAPPKDTEKKQEDENLGKPTGGSAHDLLKIAAKQKKEGNLESAIETLRKAYKINEANNEGIGIAAYLRLPMYLQKAGKNDEGWSEFNKLLTDGWSTYTNMDFEVFYYIYDIYDKMRLFLQREQRAIEAVPYGVISHIMWAMHHFNRWKHYERKKKEEENIYAKKSCDIFIKKHSDVYLGLCSNNFLPKLKENFTPLLKKAKKLDCMDEVIKITQTHIKAAPKLNIQGIHSDIERILNQ